MSTYSTIERDVLLKEYNKLTTNIDILRNEKECPEIILPPLITRVNELAVKLGYEVVK